MSNDNSNILNVGTLPVQDNTVIKKDFHTYAPYTNSFLESEEIRIAIQNQDAYLLPCESYLYMRVNVKTEKNDPNATDKVKFAHNFISFLFSSARYELNGVEIDHIRNVGITSTMKLAVASRKSNTYGYYQYNKTFADKVAESTRETVTYDVMLPLSIWFGFCDDYKKLILNSRHELILNRARSSLNCVHGGKDIDANSTSVKIELTKLEWIMPHITLADKVKYDMNQFYLTRNKQLDVQYRSWDLYEYPELPQTMNHSWTVKAVSQLYKPRYVLVALQSNRNENKIADASKFNSMKMNSIRLHMNSREYPYRMHDWDIGAGVFAQIYHAYSNIQSSYYNGVDDENLFGLSYKDFQNDALFVFDTSRADETLEHGTVDIRIEMKAYENLPAKTAAFCLIIYDNGFTYSPSNGLVVKSM